ncbi:putative hexose transport-related protein [Meredithblackwellia eburnea MCA 4105]
MAGGFSGALINKQALSTTPKEVLNWYLYFCAFIITTSGGLHGYNSSNISGILKMTDFIHGFHLKKYSTADYANITGWVTSSIVIGGLAGSLLSAPLNDMFGRKKTLWGMSLLYLVGCVIQIATDSNINQVIGARVIEGFAGGAATVTGTMYVSEVSPASVRGLLGALFSTNIMLGVCLGYWGNYGSILNISASSHWQWRVPLLIQFIPGVIICALLPFVVESPRWYALKGKNDDALASLVRIRRLPADHSFVLQEYTQILGSIESERNISVSWVGLGKELSKNKSLLRRFILVVIVQFGFNFSGGNSITYYQTSILTTIGVTGNSAYLFSGIYGLMKVAAVFIYALIFAERFGRRKMLLIGGIINILCVAWIAIYLGALPGNKKAGWASVASICIFAIGYGIGWAPNGFGLNGELFPTGFRSKMMSICIAVQYLLNFLLVRFFPNIVASIGGRGPFIIFACVSTAIVIYIFVALPEVKGVAIEHMESLFDGSWYTNGLRSSELNKAVRDEEEKQAKTITDAKAGAGSEEYLEKSSRDLV